MQVRAAREADLDQVAAIYAHYVTHSVATFETEVPPLSYWQARLADLTERRLPFLVAETDPTETDPTETDPTETDVAEAGRVVAGYAYAAPWRSRPAYRFSVEDSVYIAPGQQRRGAGSALLGGVLDACSAAGLRQVIAVITDSGDDASAALHRRLGFVAAGRLTTVGHKHGRWLDTVLMQRALT